MTPEMLMSAGRIKAMQVTPYYSTALLSLTPVSRETGQKSFIVDKKWRVYYDPSQITEMPVEMIAYEWLHVTLHVMNEHRGRFENFKNSTDESIQAWHDASDTVIAQELDKLKGLIPTPGMGLDELKQKNKNEPVEKLYNFLLGKNHQDTGNEGEGQESPDGDTSETKEEKPASDAEKSNDTQDTPKPQSENPKDPNESNEETPQDKEGTNPTEEASSSDEYSEETNSQGEPQDEQDDQKSENDEDSDDNSEENSSTSLDADSDSKPSDGPRSGQSSKEEEDEESETSESSTEENSNSTPDSCGSGQNGIPKDYEQDIDEEEYPGIPEGYEEIKLKDIAKDISEFNERNRGHVPGSVMRTIDSILKPKVDYRRALIVKIRRAAAEVAGKMDFSYRRPSRRNPNPNMTLPSLSVGKTPTLYIVLDTSGSMRSIDLARAVSEVSALMKKFRGNTYLIACDAASKEGVNKISKIQDIQLFGGGGTNMGVGIDIASNAKPAPDIILVITDGGTPWPAKPDPKMQRVKHIVLLIEGLNTRKSIPDFMDVIPVTAL